MDMPAWLSMYTPGQLHRHAPRQPQINISVINRPPVFLQEFRTGILESDVGNELSLTQGLSRERIKGAGLEVSQDACSLIRNTRRRDDRIVHNLKCDSIDEEIWYHLANTLASALPASHDQPHPFCSLIILCIPESLSDVTPSLCCLFLESDPFFVAPNLADLSS